MERVPKMLDLIEEEIDHALGKRQEQMKSADTAPVEAVFHNVRTRIEDQTKEYLIITYLRSSYVTGSHKFKIAVYKGEPFVEPPRFYEYFSMKQLYENINLEMDVFTNKIKQQFHNVLDSEIEEVRRDYMEALYMDSVVFFERVIQGIENKPDGIEVFWGEEVGDIRIIGVI